MRIRSGPPAGGGLRNWMVLLVGFLSLFQLWFGQPAEAGKHFVVQRFVDSKSESALKVLFIGNSFTYFYDMPAIFGSLCASADQKRQLKVYEAVNGGVKLEDLLNGSVQEIIKKDGPWDYVVLQEQSSRPIDDPKKMADSCKILDADIKKAGAETVLYLTWPDKKSPERQELLTRAYASIGKELHATVVPVGEAFMSVLRSHPEIELYDRDEHHPSAAGAYLTACVFYSKLIGKSPLGLPGHYYIIDPNTGLDRSLVSLTDKETEILQKEAWQSVQKATSQSYKDGSPD